MTAGALSGSATITASNEYFNSNMGRHVMKTAFKAEALVLVNSESVSFADFVMFIKPYLDHFDIPYKINDISKGIKLSVIGEYALLIIGHKDIDNNNRYLKPAVTKKMVSCIKGGAGIPSSHKKAIAELKLPPFNVKEIWAKRKSRKIDKSFWKKVIVN